MSTTAPARTWATTVLRYLPGLLLLLAVGVVGTFAQTGLRSVATATGTRLPDIEYVLWAIVIGLVIRNTVGVPAAFRPGVGTYEFWLKIGIVLLGVLARPGAADLGLADRLTLRSGQNRGVVTVADVRALALTLPRTTEHLVHDRVKFRVKQIVYCAFSRDETLMGFAFPKEEREALVAAEPAIYLLPGTSDLRFNWVVARLERLDAVTMRERVCDAWAMCVPKFLVRERLGRPRR